MNNRALREEVRGLSNSELLDELQKSTGNWKQDVTREVLHRILKILSKN